MSLASHHCAEMSMTLVILESGSTLFQDGCRVAFLGPSRKSWTCMLFGIGLSVSTIQVVLARPLQRFSIFQCGDLGWEHGSPVSVSVAVFSGSMCRVHPSCCNGACSLNLGDVHCWSVGTRWRLALLQ